MKLRREIAARVSQALVVQDGKALRAPGAKLAWHFVERDGRTVTAISQGDAFDLYFGRRSPVVVSISPKAALRLAWFLFWRWWVVSTMIGVKSWLWRWSLGVLLEPEVTDAPDSQAAPVGVRESRSPGIESRPATEA